MPNNLLTRREFAMLAGAGLLSAARKQVPIVLQLYSLNKECKADLPGTLAAVGKLGFQGVEWYGWGGYFDRTPKELRKLLDDNGLKTFSDHIHAPFLQGDRFERTIELHQTLGTKMLTLSELLGNRTNRATSKFWEDGAKMMNELAEKLKPYGMRLGLHNHAAEFVKVEDGRLPWDIVMDNTSKDIAQQMHVAAFYGAGLDPIDYMKRYPGRTASMHMVDYAPGKKELLLGEGVAKWNQIFDTAETVGGIQFYIVEQESYPYPPLESVARSFANLKKLLAQGTL